MDWYEEDYKLVAVTPVSPISADKMSTAEIRQTYRGSEYTVFVSSQAFDCTYEQIELARQKGDYIISGGEGSADSMTFFIDASEIA